MKKLLAVVATFAIASQLTSCDRFKKKKDDNKDEGGSTALTGPESIAGEWVGGYRSLTEDSKPLGDVRPAQISFNSTDESSSFSLKLLDDETAAVSGEWLWFENKKLFLTVKKSTISRLPVSTAMLDADYDLIGNSLHITGKSFELILSRKNVTTTTSDKLNLGTGTWLCDKSPVMTRLSIANDYNWKGTIFQEERRSVAVSGNGTRISEDTIYLKIVTSSVEVAADSYLKFVVSGDRSHLESVTKTRTDDLGECTRN